MANERLWMTLASAWCLINVACGGDGAPTLASVSMKSTAPTVVNASNVEELYAAVNDPANADAVVMVASGVYTLTPRDSNLAPRPNGGHLVLQPGMRLVGQNEYVDFDGDGVWDPRDDDGDGVPDTDPVRGLIFAAPATETVLDAGELSGGAGVPGAVRLGLENAAEKLTVRNSSGIGAGVDVNVLPASGGMQAEVRDCLVEDGQRGIRCTHPAVTEVDSSAVLERNISRRHTGSFGFGVIIQNNGSTQCSWDVIVRNNLVYANRLGLFVVGNSATSSQSQVLSMGNIYRQNEAGLNIDAGRDAFAAGLPAGSNGCSIDLTSHGDRIVDNVGTSVVGGLGGGVVAIAGFRTSPSGSQSSNNSLELRFIQTIWSGNFQGTSPRDLQVYGAFAPGSTPGTGDTARVLIRQATSDGAAGAFQFIDSQPTDPTGSDRVTIIGSSDVAAR
jgi:hypothetical protein